MADLMVQPDLSENPGRIPEGFIYRDQRKRYPWWVKSTDRISVETDASRIEKPTTHMIIMSVMKRMSDPDMPSQRKNMTKRIKPRDMSCRMFRYCLRRSHSGRPGSI